MINARFEVPRPDNEPVRAYAPGSTEREALKRELERQASQTVEIPLVIGGERVKTSKQLDVVCPHDHGHVLARMHLAGPAEIERAISVANEAWKSWSALPWRARLSVFLKAAELLSGPRRYQVNAATMLGQSKTAHQAEIDAACELIDFLRFNAHFACRLMQEQPSSPGGIWNYVDHRPLEGFVLAVTPFNFTAIAGNLPSAPAMVGNVALWKPSSTQGLASHYVMQAFEDAGLPPGVINFVPGSGRVVGPAALKHRDLAGVHFTGSTATFQSMWKTLGENIASYRSYPRIVGETGGKDFIVAHPSADPDQLLTALVRGAFEYQGQKCSAVSRAYLPRSLFDTLKKRLVEQTEGLSMGSPDDFTNFLCAVIDRKAFDKIKEYIEFARDSADGQILAGGECDDNKGYFIRPTIVQALEPDMRLMREEIFGPVLTVYVYEDDSFDEILELCDQGSPYALTGAIFARDRSVVEQSLQRLRFAAGNFYINDKPTGSIVNQQPFGGARASGTNDKAGSIANIMRWISPRAIKETFVAPTDYRYPFMDEP